MRHHAGCGKPFFVSGSFDDAGLILRQLERTAGAGNYHYLVGIGASPDGLLLDDDGA